MKLSISKLVVNSLIYGHEYEEMNFEDKYQYYVHNKKSSKWDNFSEIHTAILFFNLCHILG